MPWASAKVKGVIIAETDFPQVVSGDVYVSLIWTLEAALASRSWIILTTWLPLVSSGVSGLWSCIARAITKIVINSCVKWEYLSEASQSKKSSQRHYNISVNGTTVSDAAWCHADPPRKLESVKNHVAFVGMAPVMIKCMGPQSPFYFIFLRGILNVRFYR